MSRWSACACLCVVAACGGGEAGPGPDSGSRAPGDAEVADAARGGSPSDASVHPAGATRADAAVRRDAGSATEDGDSGVVDDPIDHDLSALCLDCPGDQKLCAGTCVSVRAPEYGCGGESCAACKLPHAAAACSDHGACILAGCEPGWSDCDQDAANGCEADLSDPAHCAGCGPEHACADASPLCGPTGCISACAPPLTQCGERCVDLLSSASACGSCSSACTSGDAPNQSGFPSCMLAQCGRTCSAGYTSCGDRCVDLTRTVSDCGSCGHACDADQVCESSACAPRPCSNGWKSCDGSCVAPQVDPLNCGRCGRSCGADQTCAAGTCVSTSSQWLQTGLQDPFDLVVDAERLYWIERGESDGKLVTSLKQGGAPASLASGQRRPTGLVVDDHHAYWSNNLGGAIMRAPRDGSAPATVVTAATSPGVIAVDAAYVYVPRSGGLDRVAKSGGTPQAFATIPFMPAATTVLAMVVDSGTLYVLTQYGRSWRVWRVDAQGAAELVHGSDDSSALPILSTDAAGIYLAHVYDQRSFLGIARIEKATGDFHTPYISSEVRSMTRALTLTAFALADCGAFWTDGMALYLGRSGRPDQAALARGQIRALALDATSVYWTDGSGAIGRVAKP